MKTLFGIGLVYGIIWSGIQASWTMIEYDATIRAFNAGSPHAELRHRINGQSGQICFFLANLIAIGSGIGYTLAGRSGSAGRSTMDPNG